MKGKNIIAFLALLAFLLVTTAVIMAGPVENVPYWWKGRNFSGNVTAVGKYKLFVVNKENITKEFDMEKDTRIFLRNGQNIKKGMYIKVTYKETKQKNIAKAIREIKPME